MNIDNFIKELELIINSDLYDKNLITYSDYLKVINEVRKKKKCI
mgnify:CR=1 FL=1